jgi:hypothetical protein
VSNETPPRSGPTIVLVGGQMTVDDGSPLDSRQVVEGDDQAEVMLRTLTSSLLWWRAAISVVKPMLESSGAEAFALVLGIRTVMEVRADGSPRRTRLRSLLPGGTSDAEIIRSGIKQPLPEGYEKAIVLQGHGEEYSDLGTVGFKRGTPGTRWWFLRGSDWYLHQVGPIIKPAVVVTTMPWGIVSDLYTARQYEAFESTRLFSDDLILVAPHTSSSDTYVRGYSAWNDAGRPPDPELAWSDLPAMPEQTRWDPDARPDSIHYATPIPISAHFGVTGLYQNGDWRDPADLEAARSLLEARYDLKIGIWDLASNPTLRQTLLDVVPVLPPPPVTAAVPVAAAKRAEARVDAAMEEREVQKRSLTARLSELRALSEIGWIPRDDRERWLLRLLMSEQYIRDFDQEPYPLLQLELFVGKRTSSVTAFTILYWAVDLPAYVESRRRTFEDVATPDECRLGELPVELLRVGGGWADENVDWHERGDRLAGLTGQWRVAFADFIDEARRKVPTHWAPA